VRELHNKGAPSHWVSSMFTAVLACPSGQGRAPRAGSGDQMAASAGHVILNGGGRQGYRSLRG